MVCYGIFCSGQLLYTVYLSEQLIISQDYEVVLQAFRDIL